MLWLLVCLLFYSVKLDCYALGMYSGFLHLKFGCFWNLTNFIRNKSTREASWFICKVNIAKNILETFNNEPICTKFINWNVL